MPYFKSMADDAGPRSVFGAHPDIYRPWSEMAQALMNGPSPLTEGEREFILAFVAGAAGCEFVLVAHAEVAYAQGVPHGLVEAAVVDLETADIDDRMRTLLRFARKLMVTPTAISQADADAVFDAGWDERALHDVIAVTARAAFMQRLVQGHGFVPLSREEAAARAQSRAKLGYVDIIPEFRNAG